MSLPKQPEGDTRKPNLLERALSIVTVLRAGEGVDALLLTSSVFVCLVGYYLLKVLREPLVLASGGAVSKAYATAVQAVIMLIAVPLYARLAKRADPRRLIIGITLTVVVLLEVFAWLSELSSTWVGFAFYVLVGIVGVLFVSQFWSFANDLVDEERGERIFPLAALGATAGSWVGSVVAGRMLESGMSVPTLLRIAAGIFIVHALAYALIDRRVSPKEEPMSRPSIAPSHNGLALVWESPYLRLFAIVIVVISLVNSNSEFLLGNAIETSTPAGALADRRAAIGAAYGEFFGNVNLLAILFQTFVASRLARYGGVRATLVALPIIALATSSTMAFGLAFAVFRFTKTIENACDYSITNTARALLWLPTTRDEKYKAKMTIDTVFVRFADLISAALVQLVFVWFGRSPSRFAFLNMALCVLALVLVQRLLAHRARLTHRA